MMSLKGGNTAWMVQERHSGISYTHILLREGRVWDVGCLSGGHCRALSEASNERRLERQYESPRGTIVTHVSGLHGRAYHAAPTRVGRLLLPQRSLNSAKPLVMDA